MSCNNCGILNHKVYQCIAPLGHGNYGAVCGTYLDSYPKSFAECCFNHDGKIECTCARSLCTHFYYYLLLIAITVIVIFVIYKKLALKFVVPPTFIFVVILLYLLKKPTSVNRWKELNCKYGCDKHMNYSKA